MILRLFVFTLLAKAVCSFMLSRNTFYLFKYTTTSNIICKTKITNLCKISFKYRLTLGEKISNPFDFLPWNIEKKVKREDRRKKIEASLLYRQLGITTDATFEEITAITNDLTTKSGENIKRKLELEIIKDKLMQIKLNERISGITVMSAEARAQTQIEEDEKDEEMSLPKTKIPEVSRLSNFCKGLTKKPDPVYARLQIKVFGFLSIFAFILPPMADFIIMVNWMFAAGQIARRGMPKSHVGEFHPYNRAGGSHQRKAVFLSLGVWVILRIITPMLGNIRQILGLQYVTVVELIVMNIFLGIFTAYTQTYKVDKPS